MDDRRIADWLLSTLRLFNVTEQTAHEVIALFLGALAAPRSEPKE